MKKKIKYLLFIILCNLFMYHVNAASATINARASKTQVQEGQNVTVTVTVSSSSALGSWSFNVGYDSGVLQFVDSNLENGLSSAAVVSNGNTKSKTYTINFKAKKAGSAKITVNSASVYGWDESTFGTSTSGTTIKVVGPTSNKNSNSTKPSNSNSTSNSNISDKKSANNDLVSLSVEGYDINPQFNKNTTKYSLSVPNNTRKIRINAKADDSSASITGIGYKELKEGKNSFDVVVRAENGNRKTYQINITVQDKDPIKVHINGEKYTVVQKRESMTAPSNYVDTTVTIDGIEVPAFTNDLTKFNLVGLTNEQGDTKLYIYTDDNYKLYNEYKFNGISLYVKTPDKEIKNSKKINIKLNDEEITAYKVSNSYPLIYGMNLETGEENWYTYDESEKTLQKYVTGNRNVSDDGKLDIQDNLTDANSKYKLLSYIMCGISGILFIFMILAMIKISNQNKNVS